MFFSPFFRLWFYSRLYSVSQVTQMGGRVTWRNRCFCKPTLRLQPVLESTAQTLRANALKLSPLKEFHLKTQVVLLKAPPFFLYWYSTYEAQCIVLKYDLNLILT